jgi:PilZ domain-containing protein
MDEEDELHLDEQDERRLHDRSRLIIDVFFDGQDATGVASTKDISIGGLYMNTQAQLREGSVLLIRIPLMDGQVVTNAEVVYVNDGTGVGLRFQGLSAEDRTALERELATD